MVLSNLLRFSYVLFLCSYEHVASAANKAALTNTMEGATTRKYVTTRYYEDPSCTSQLGPEFCHLLGDCFPFAGMDPLLYGQYRYDGRLNATKTRRHIQEGTDTFIMSTYSDITCTTTNILNPASIISNNCKESQCCVTTLIRGVQAKIAYFVFTEIDVCPLDDQVAGNISLSPFSVIFSRVSFLMTYVFYGSIILFIFALGISLGIVCSYYYYFGTSKNRGYHEVGIYDISSDDEPVNLLTSYMLGKRNTPHSITGIKAARTEIQEQMSQVS